MNTWKLAQVVYSLPVIDLMKLCHGRVISLERVYEWCKDKEKKRFGVFGLESEVLNVGLRLRFIEF